MSSPRTGAATARPPWLEAILSRAVIVAALGYFVDIYDLVLFSIVRVPSLRSLGVSDGDMMTVGVRLLNLQMAGMLLGGLLWGVLGDRRGRVTVLFGSILLYSVANIANAFATSTEVYGWLRFLAGIGLAGELGAAITLVSESLPAATRGYGTSFVAGFGVSGAMLAAAVAAVCDWQIAYVVGGLMGLLLLGLRVKTAESGLFATVAAKTHVARGSLRLLFADRDRLATYVRCIVIGLPTWYVIGILVTFSPELCRQLGATGEVSAGTAILCCYAGLVAGDFASGLASQWLRSRRQVILTFALASLAVALLYLNTRGQEPLVYYAFCVALGVTAGYWALFVTIAAEQFGTNLRATVATTVPNFVRGAVVPLTISVKALSAPYGLVSAAVVVGLTAFALAFLAFLGLRETFGRDLDFVDQ